MRLLQVESNMKVKITIYIVSLVLLAVNKEESFENSTFPSWWEEEREPKPEAGISKGLKLFLDYLHNSDKKFLHSMILFALLQFMYDDMSLQVLLQHGVTQVFVQLIKDYIAGNIT